MTISTRKPLTRTRRLISLLVAAAALLTFSGVSFGAGVGEVTYTKGTVDITRAGRTQAVPLNRGDQIQVGDVIRTKSDSKAEVTYVDGSIVNMAEKTRFEVKEFTYQPKQNLRNTLFKTFRGMIRVFASKFEGRGGSKFEVESPSAVAGVRGTTWTQTPDYVAVHEGVVEVWSADPNFPGKVEVPANMMVFTPKGAPPSEPKQISSKALSNILNKTSKENGDNGGSDQGGDENGDDGSPVTESDPVEGEMVLQGTLNEISGPGGPASLIDPLPPVTPPSTETVPELLGTLPVNVNINFPPRP